MLEIRYNLGWTLSSVEQQCICLIDETIFIRSNGIQLIMLCRRPSFCFLFQYQGSHRADVKLQS